MWIHIVVHCYDEKYPHYGAFQKLQSFSLMEHKTRAFLTYTLVICEGSDIYQRITSEMLVRSVKKEYCNNIKTNKLELPPEKFFRRSIGRNIAAKESGENFDLVWFCDCDYLFGEGCLDSLCDVWEAFDEKPDMIYPRYCKANTSHSVGRQIANNVLAGKDYDIQEKDFSRMAFDRAIGGLQIVNGEYAYENGYLDSSRRYQREIDKPKGVFPNFRDDPAFRIKLERKGTIVPIELKNLYRLRHDEVGYEEGRKPVSK